MDKSTANLGRWLRTHRLPDTFPLLSKGRDIPLDKLFFRDEGRELSRILDNIQGSPRTMVIFPPGQGATTTLRAVVGTARQAALRLPHLFVTIDPSGLDEDDFGEAFLAHLRESLFNQLINGGWEQALYGNRRQKLFDILGVADSDALDDLRFTIEQQRASEVGVSTALQELAKAYADEEGRLIMLLHQNLNLSTFLIIDFPNDAEDSLVSRTLREIKWFDENGKPREKFPAAALAEAWFFTQRQAEYAQSIWQRDYNSVVIDPFNEQEIFAILSAHFAPHLGGRPVPLGSVFSQNFVHRAWAEGRPIADMMQRIRDDMLRALDIPSGHVPYLLSPRD